MADVLAAFGHLDVLVNNAGVPLTCPAVEVTEAQWSAVIDVNLKECGHEREPRVLRQVARPAPVLLRGFDSSSIARKVLQRAADLLPHLSGLENLCSARHHPMKRGVPKRSRRNGGESARPGPGATPGAFCGA